jgi:hypothetical protein
MDNLDFVGMLRERAEEFRPLAESTAEEHTKNSLFELSQTYAEWADAEEIAASVFNPR